MPVELPLLVKEIHRQASLQGVAPPGATRLVKLLYLADLEWRRQHGGGPLARLSWRFLHFGPYPCELADRLGGPDVEKIQFQTGKVAHRLILETEVLEGSETPEEICGLLARPLKNRYRGRPFGLDPTCADFVSVFPADPSFIHSTNGTGTCSRCGGGAVKC